MSFFSTDSSCTKDHARPFLSPTRREVAGKHTAPVWQLFWAELEKGREEDVGEVLMSISTGMWPLVAVHFFHDSFHLQMVE
jgi:hypothetical protein